LARVHLGSELKGSLESRAELYRTLSRPCRFGHAILSMQLKSCHPERSGFRVVCEIRAVEGSLRATPYLRK